jgi:hypothetical protein
MWLGFLVCDRWRSAVSRCTAVLCGFELRLLPGVTN